MIIANNKIVANDHVVSRFNGKTGGNKGENTAGVIVNMVCLHNCVTTVFDFNTRDAVKYIIVGNVYVVAHTNVNSCIFYAGDYVVLNNTVLTKLRKDAINTRVYNNVVTNLPVVASLTHDAIALVSRNGEVFDHNVVSGVKNGIIQFSFTIQHGAIALLDNTNQPNTIFIYIDCFFIRSGHDLNRCTRLSLLHRCLNRFAIIDNNYHIRHRWSCNRLRVPTERQLVILSAKAALVGGPSATGGDDRCNCGALVFSNNHSSCERRKNQDQTEYFPCIHNDSPDFVVIIAVCVVDL